MRRYLETVPGFTGFSDLPEVRAPGDWPGKAETEKFAQLLGVITVLALLSALVLISNTMSTLVAEQTGEIGIMRADRRPPPPGGARLPATALLLGALGALVGIVLGIVLANLLAGYFGSMFWAVDVGFGVDPMVVLVSLLVGCWRRRSRRCPRSAAASASTCARRSSRPARRSAVRTPPTGCCGARFLPRTMQIGLRNVGRRKRRSLATALIVALAVGNLLASWPWRRRRPRPRARRGATTSRTCRSRPAGERSSTSAPSG